MRFTSPPRGRLQVSAAYRRDAHRVQGVKARKAVVAPAEAAGRPRFLVFHTKFEGLHAYPMRYIVLWHSPDGASARCGVSPGKPLCCCGHCP